MLLCLQICRTISIYLVIFHDRGTLSKAFSKSVYITSIHPPSSNVAIQISSILSNWRTVDLPVMKPYCFLLKRLLSLKYVFHDVISYNRLHCFTSCTGQGDWSVDFDFTLASFFVNNCYITYLPIFKKNRVLYGAVEQHCHRFT